MNYKGSNKQFYFEQCLAEVELVLFYVGCIGSLFGQRLMTFNEMNGLLLPKCLVF